MTAYHRLARETPGFQHWRLPVAAVVGALFYIALSVVLAVVLAVVVVAHSGDADWIDSMGAEIDLDRPGVLLLQLGTIALFIPTVLGSVWLVWRPHTGYLHSVEGRLRWRWLGHCLALAFAVVGASLALSVAVSAALGDGVGGAAWPTGARAWSLLVVLLVVPFQAAGEEYLFRGALMQLIGSWTKRAAVPVVVTTLLFAAGHVYNIWGLLSVAVFGLTAAVLTIRTGGLEAAIGLHVANNVLLMVLDLVGVIDSSGEGAGFLDEVLPTALMCLVFALLVERSARRRRLVRRRPPLTAAVTIQPVPTYPPPGAAAVVPGPFEVVDHGTDHPKVPPNAPSYPGDPGTWGR